VDAASPSWAAETPCASRGTPTCLGTSTRRGPQLSTAHSGRHSTGRPGVTVVGRLGASNGCTAHRQPPRGCGSWRACPPCCTACGHGTRRRLARSCAGGRTGPGPPHGRRRCPPAPPAPATMAHQRSEVEPTPPRPAGTPKTCSAAASQSPSVAQYMGRCPNTITCSSPASALLQPCLSPVCTRCRQCGTPMASRCG